jgi:hypothetical protein
MKSLIENSLAGALKANIPGLAASLPGHQAEVLPDDGTCLVVVADVEHRAGPLNVADVTFRLSTPVPEADGPTTPREHGEYEPLSSVTAGAFTEGTLKLVSAKFTESVDDVPEGSQTFKAYESIS